VDGLTAGSAENAEGAEAVREVVRWLESRHEVETRRCQLLLERLMGMEVGAGGAPPGRRGKNRRFAWRGSTKDTKGYLWRRRDGSGGFPAFDETLPPKGCLVGGQAGNGVVVQGAAAGGAVAESRTKGGPGWLLQSGVIGGE